MENNYSVAISCHSDLGYIEYTADTKSANIVLANEVAKQKVEEFLNTPLTLQVPHERFIKYIIGYKKLHLIFIFMNLLNVVFLF